MSYFKPRLAVTVVGGHGLGGQAIASFGCIALTSHQLQRMRTV
jgi:hypothetical protein